MTGLESLVTPKGLQKGDTVATISLSWGGAGELPARYAIGKKRLEEVFGLKVIETSNSLQSAQWISEHPKERADDLMEAFRNPSVKGIISNIGGDDSMRILPYIDLDVIRNNPKIFLGFSDSTITHFICLKAGLSSFYGTSVLCGFAENVEMHNYQVKDIKDTLFGNNESHSYSSVPNTTSTADQPESQKAATTCKRRRILPNLDEGWTSERLDWFNASRASTKRTLVKDKYIGWNFLQGFASASSSSTSSSDSGEKKKIVTGRLIGGCMEVLEMLKGTTFWPSLDIWRGSVIFFETSEEKPRPDFLRWWLRNYATQGILAVCNGLLFGRAYDGLYQEEYDAEVLRVLGEEGLVDLPVITQMDFGHTAPAFTLPFGRLVEVDCEKRSVTLLEPSVL